MSPAGVFFSLALLGPAVLAGWGWIVLRLTGVRGLSLPMTMALGMSGLLFLGGILNLARLARPPAIDGLVGIGLAAAMYAAVRLAGLRRLRWSPGRAAVLMAVVLAGGFVLRNLTPQRIYNWADDFERYFSYPVRMLQTGTIGGNPLSVAGIDSLGGQAFLQAFVVRYFPLDYLGSLESAIALLLCLALTGSTLPGWKGAVLSAAGVVAFVAIDPKIVNVSSVYTTAALIMAACRLAESATGIGSESAHYLLLGLIYAGLVSLKSINVVFVAAHFGLLVVTDAAVNPEPRTWLRRWSWAGLTALLATLPWAAVHTALYRAALGAPASAPPGSAVEPYRELFSLKPAYRSPALLVTVTALAGLLLSAGLLVAVRRAPRSASPAARSAFAAGLSGAVSFAVLIAVLAPRMYGQGQSLRYACPILMATTPMALVMLGECGAGFGSRAWSVAVFGGFAVGAIFFAPLRERIRQMASQGCPLAYARTAAGRMIDSALAYDGDVLHGDVRATHRRLQALVPPGEAIIVWTGAPFWLDYARNPIFNTDPPGLAMPRRAFPPARFLIFQYQGVSSRDNREIAEMLHDPAGPVRKLGAAIMDFYSRVRARRLDSDVLFNDGRYLLLRQRL